MMEFQEQLRLLTQRKTAADGGVQAQVPEGTARLGGTLFDAGSFVEIGALQAEANCLTGHGLVNGRPAYLIAQDPEASGGAMGQAQAAKMVRALDMAERACAPVVFLLNSQGAKVLEGAQVLGAYADVFTRMSALSGVCPMLAVVNGPCVGAAAHFVGLADIAIAVEKSAVVLPASASVLHAVHGVDAKTVGTADAGLRQGTVALTSPDEAAALALAAALVDLLPSSAMDMAPFVEGDDLNRLLDDAAAGSGLHLVQAMADHGTGIELYAPYGKRAHTLLARVGGRTCGIISTEFAQEAGRLDAASCDKIARFVRFCDTYDLHVLTLIDSEGLDVPTQDEQPWLMRAASDMLAAYADASCPKVAVVTGNAIGTAYVAFAGRSVADVTYAWPASVISPLTKEAAVQTFEADQIKDTDRATLEAQYAQEADGLHAAQQGLVDDVIDPAQTRKYVIAAMEMLDGR